MFMFSEDQYWGDMAGLLRAFKEEYGETAYDVAVRHLGEKAIVEWGKKAEEHGSNTIADFIKLLWEPLKGNVVDYSVTESEEGFQIICTRCTYSEMAKRNGITDECYYLDCATDPYKAKGFNPKIGFKRNKTLIEGHNCCNHFYYMNDTP